MKCKRLAYAALPCAAALFGLATTAASAQSAESINFGSAAQTIEGFGGATAWLPGLTTAQASTLFGRANNNEVGLSILGVRIDPAGRGEPVWDLHAERAGRERHL